MGYTPTVEEYGFGLFLCCLGYVAAKRALDRDRQLASLHQELEIANVYSFRFSHQLPAVGALYRCSALCADDCGRRRLRPSSSRSVVFPGAGLFVADVSGHGVPAALIASMVKMAINSQRQHVASPEQLLAGVNEALCGSTHEVSL